MALYSACTADDVGSSSLQYKQPLAFPTRRLVDAFIDTGDEAARY